MTATVVGQRPAGASGVVVSVVAGTSIDVDATDAANPVVRVEPGAFDPQGTAAGLVGTEATTRANADTAEANARAAADALLVPLAQKGAAGGVATLDGSSLIPAAQLPSVAVTDTFVVNSQAAMLALAAQRGDVAVRTDLSKSFILSTDNPGTLADWKELLTPTDAVSSVNGRVGAVTGLAEQTDLVAETNRATAAEGSKIDKATLDANTVLVANVDDTPVALPMGPSTILVRLASGGIVAGTPAQVAAVLAGEAPFTGTYVALTALDTDGTLAANSDAKVATQKAVKTYADQIIASADAMVFKGVVDCSANPNYPAADRGHTYRVSVAGKIGGASGTNVEAGDLLLCLTDGTAAGTQAAVGAQWSIAQTNVDGAVVGPASATSGNVATFSGTTGKVVQDGGTLGTAAFVNTGTGASNVPTITQADARYATAAQGATADGAIPKSLVDAKGDLLVGTADNVLARRAVGNNGDQLVADSAQSDGMRWMAHRYRRKTGSALYYMNDTTAVSGSFTLIQSRLYLVPFPVGQTLTVDRIAVNVQTNIAATTIRLGIYSATDSVPTTLVLDAGTVDSTTTGDKELTISQSLAPGLYFLGCVGQGAGGLVIRGVTYSALLTTMGSPTLADLTATTAYGTSWRVGSVTGALPSTPTVDPDNSNVAPRVIVRIT